MADGVIEAEVAIIGAGPSGAATAVHLGQLGVQGVVLVDRADFPREKTCGSGISPKGIAYLRKLGVWDTIAPQAYRIQGLRLVTPGDREVFLSGGDAAAAVVCARRVMDEALVRRAQSLGVQFVPDFTAHSLTEAGGRTTGFRTRDGREVRARYTVVAEGAHTRLAIDRGPRRMLQAIMGWWEGVGFTDHHVEMVFDPMVAPLYGWLFPESADRVNVGICYEDDARRQNARDLFRRFLARQYETRLHGARQIGDFKGHPIVYSYGIDRLHAPGRVVVGEAGRMTHPATGEGIYQGFRTGMLAAEALRDVLRDGATEREAFARYETRCRTAFLASFWSAKVFQRIIRSPAIDWAVRTSERPSVKKFAGTVLARM